MTADEPEIIQVEALPAGGRDDTVGRVFDALQPGAGVVLRANHDPRDLLRYLQATRPNAFEWWPLEQGPDTWRILLAKADAPVDAPRTVTDVMCADHRRLDRLYARTYRAIEANELREARAVLADFAVGLRRHIEAEEDILIPMTVDDQDAGAAKNAEQMLTEHRRIRAALTAAHRALQSANGGLVGVALEALTEMRFVLEGHNQNEERWLYPVCDRAADPDERVDLIRRIQAL